MSFHGSSRLAGVPPAAREPIGTDRRVTVAIAFATIVLHLAAGFALYKAPPSPIGRPSGEATVSPPAVSTWQMLPVPPPQGDTRPPRASTPRLPPTDASPRAAPRTSARRLPRPEPPHPEPSRTVERGSQEPPAPDRSEVAPSAGHADAGTPDRTPAGEPGNGPPTGPPSTARPLNLDLPPAAARRTPMEARGGWLHDALQAERNGRAQAPGAGASAAGAPSRRVDDRERIGESEDCIELRESRAAGLDPYAASRAPRPRQGERCR